MILGEYKKKYCPEEQPPTLCAPKTPEALFLALKQHKFSRHIKA